MISFLLNDQLIKTDLAPGTVLLDFIRYHRNLPGTKIGCREGDCGACTILVGSLSEKGVSYRSMTSCLVPLANVQGKHIVTVEGINNNALTAVQRTISDEAATQCGFCTPGIVMSLTGYCLQYEGAAPEISNAKTALACLDGNICRCTGYKSIERAAVRIAQLMHTKTDETALQFLVRQQVVPAYFADVHATLASLSSNGEKYEEVLNRHPVFIGGGTDLYVQQPDQIEKTVASHLSSGNEMTSVKSDGKTCIIGGSATVSDVMESPLFTEHFANINTFKKLVSSTPIRNMATISGNFVNASPIGDLTIFFLALDLQLTLSNGVTTRKIPLRKFYKAYKKLDKTPDEYIQEMHFDLPSATALFNFEKVSKRTNLDIASVNSALLLQTSEEGTIIKIGLSAGGVGPVPLYLEKTCDFLTGKIISTQTIREALQIAVSEITPISDARGSATYKKLLLQQLIKSHFIRLLPGIAVSELITAELH